MNYDYLTQVDEYMKCIPADDSIRAVLRAVDVWVRACPCPATIWELGSAPKGNPAPLSARTFHSSCCPRAAGCSSVMWSSWPGAPAVPTRTDGKNGSIFDCFYRTGTASAMHDNHITIHYISLDLIFF